MPGHFAVFSDGIVSSCCDDERDYHNEKLEIKNKE